MTSLIAAWDRKRGFKTGGYDAIEDREQGRPYDPEPPVQIPPRSERFTRTVEWTEGYRDGYAVIWKLI